jgi:peptide/nickel transport system permease protein
MAGWLIRRLLQALVVALVMALIIFIGVSVIGNPVDMLISPQATQADYDRIVADFGLDKLLWLQFLLFLASAMHGDLGKSFVFGEPALHIILQRLPATLELAVSALILALLIGIPLGLYAGLRPKTVAARGIMVISILGFSLPTFWVAILFVMLFSVSLGWLPSGGRGSTVEVFGIQWSFMTLDGIKHLVMPALNLALFKISLMIRLTRAGVREVLPQEYIKFARAKGLSERRVICVHVLKNILIPVTTVIGLEFGSLIAFSIVTESIFAWPGIGKLIIDSINTLDRPMIVAYLMLVVFMFVTINLVVDIIYMVLDPRVRVDGEA